MTSLTDLLSRLGFTKSKASNEQNASRDPSHVEEPCPTSSDRHGRSISGEADTDRRGDAEFNGSQALSLENATADIYARCLVDRLNPARSVTDTFRPIKCDVDNNRQPSSGHISVWTEKYEEFHRLVRSQGCLMSGSTRMEKVWENWRDGRIVPPSEEVRQMVVSNFQGGEEYGRWKEMEAYCRGSQGR